jgi:hypothetical protein
MGKPTAAQLALINQKALVPLTEDQVYTFSAKVIGTKLIQKYMMQLTPNLLGKFAEQAKEGIALLIDHPWQKWEALSFPYGRTFDSRIQVEGQDQELYADHYMVLGQEIDDISTDQLATGIDGGTIFDTSAGFFTIGGKCSICGGEYYNNSDCMHIRGFEYDGKTCIIIADEGELMENSIVFDGGYEGAGIVKNSLSHKKADEKGEQKALIPVALDSKSLPGDGKVFYFFSNRTGLSSFVQQGQTNAVLAAQENKGADHVNETEVKAQTEALTQSKAALDKSNGLIGQIKTSLGIESEEGIVAKITALSAQAKDGETYKTKITEEACGAGVRALGEAFNVDAMKLSLSGLPVAEIEKVRDTYEAQAKAVLGNGGRQTVGADVNLPAGASAGAPPANPQAAGADATPEQKQEKAREEARAALKNTGH